jgi:ABC-type sugar transport system ATPase subunit
VQREGDVLQLVSLDGSMRVNAPEHLRQPLLEQTDDHFILGIRPLHIHLAKDGTDEATAANTCDGVVYVFERLGTRGALSVTVGQHKLDIITPIELDFAIDEAVRVVIEAENIMIFNSKTEQNILFA